MKAPPPRRGSPPGAIALFCAGMAAGVLGAALPLMTDAVQPAPAPQLAKVHAEDAMDDWTWLCNMVGTACQP